MERASERLAELLRARGREWPAPIEFFEELSSTNDVLKIRARDAAPEWSVVLAERQTQGRGRHGRAWISAPGNLHLSVLIRPALPADAASVLPLAAGLAVCLALSERGVAAELKWPNDVLARERKLAGVLVEGASGVRGIESAVVGVGVNVGVVPAELPPQEAERTTSIAAETGGPADILVVAAAVLAHLSVCYDALAREGPATVVQGWLRHAVPWWGRGVEVRSEGRTLSGIARGVDARGALLLEDAAGRVCPVLSGEVRALRLGEP